MTLFFTTNNCSNKNVLEDPPAEASIKHACEVVLYPI